ncbi:hypothetical protein OHS59_00830 [Streptomyces sp. NBC_00414]|uniref:hypothetical protein n=1 Tax=Streptomyces sp. NBC_00414 TaxID=2975739 RepID=UPI002E1B05CA
MTTTDTIVAPALVVATSLPAAGPRSRMTSGRLCLSSSLNWRPRRRLGRVRSAWSTEESARHRHRQSGRLMKPPGTLLSWSPAASSSLLCTGGSGEAGAVAEAPRTKSANEILECPAGYLNQEFLTQDTRA